MMETFLVIILLFLGFLALGKLMAERKDPPKQ